MGLPQITQVPVTTQSGLAWSAQPNSTDVVTLWNQDLNNIVYVGFTNTVSANGPNTLPISPNMSFQLPAKNPIYVIGASNGIKPLVIIPGSANPFLGLTQAFGSLVLPAIHSPNFSTGVSGWTINKDGSAEFNNLTIRGTFFGTTFIINSSGAFFYSAAPALGNLVASIATNSGTDSFGNTYTAGITSYHPNGAGGFFSRAFLSSSGDLELQSSSTAAVGIISTAAAGGGGSAITIQTEGYTGDSFNDLVLQSPNAGGVGSWNGTEFDANFFNAPVNTYTPTWTVAAGTNPVIGNGTITGRFIQLGKWVFFNVAVQSGSTTTFGTGNYLFSLPVTASTVTIANIVATVRNAGSAGFPFQTGRLNTVNNFAIIRPFNETLASDTNPGGYVAGTAFFDMTGMYLAA
jgi:hypothetical protein